MSTYLMSAKGMPFTAADIRAELALLDPIHDGLITAFIGQTVIMCEARWRTPLRRQTWAVQRIKGQPLGMFFKAVHAIGKHPKIGPAYRITLNAGDALGPYHDCTFEADRRQLAKVKAMIVNACWDDFGVSSTILRERRGEFRTVWPDRRAVPAMQAAE